MDFTECIFCGKRNNTGEFVFGPRHALCFECLALCHTTMMANPRYAAALMEVRRCREAEAEGSRRAWRARCSSCGAAAIAGHGDLSACKSCLVGLAGEISADSEGWCTVRPSSAILTGSRIDDINAQLSADMALAYDELEQLEDALAEAVLAVLSPQFCQATAFAGRLLLRSLSPHGSSRFCAHQGRWPGRG